MYTNHWLSKGETLQNLVQKVFEATSKISTKSEKVKWEPLFRLTWNKPLVTIDDIANEWLQVLKNFRGVKIFHLLFGAIRLLEYILLIMEQIVWVSRWFVLKKYIVKMILFRNHSRNFLLYYVCSADCWHDSIDEWYRLLIQSRYLGYNHRGYHQQASGQGASVSACADLTNQLQCCWVDPAYVLGKNTDTAIIGYRWSGVGGHQALYC